ncbi:MAG: GGDEF domain-containing protein [Oligoflexales bacterium]|nr:GGDEF domain-containing protein [Oligoflexales bacterium]
MSQYTTQIDASTPSSSSADTPAGNSNDQLVLEMFKVHELFCKAVLDAYVLMGKNGKILKFNPLFSMLLGKKQKQILKSGSLEELINFQINGGAFTLKDLYQYSQPTRLDEVRGSTELSPDLNLIVGVFPFVSGGETVGIFMLLRDVTAETNLQDKYKVKSTQSITDKLTGLYNRAYFDQYLPEAIKQVESRGERERAHLSIIMADIDHFKKINDNYGHLAGDYVLENVSAVFSSIFRKTDVICRYGGEEFLAILPSTDKEEAFQAAEKLRKAVAAGVYEFNGVKIPVTISMGVAEIDVGKEIASQALARADAALYHSKESGRNKVSVNDKGAIR